MDEKQLRIVRALTDAGALEELRLFLKMIGSAGEEDCGESYEDFIERTGATCKVCNTPITRDILDKNLIRNLDCAVTNWIIGCCCCGTGPEYHKASEAQYFCGKECRARFRAVYSAAIDATTTYRHRQIEFRTAENVTEEERRLYEENERRLRVLGTVSYADSADLF